MPSFNRVTLMGNLTRDPQVKQLPNTTVAEFGLAMSRRFRSGDGEDREDVCFVDCAAFGKQAEVIAQYCTKGRPLFVEGRLKFDTWDDRAGGKRSKVSVVVENFQFLGSRDGNGSPDGQAGGSDHGRSADAGEGRRGARGRGTGDREDKAKFAQADIPF